jgi:hypothetical protein
MRITMLLRYYLHPDRDTLLFAVGAPTPGAHERKVGETVGVRGSSRISRLRATDEIFHGLVDA